MFLQRIYALIFFLVCVWSYENRKLNCTLSAKRQCIYLNNSFCMSSKLPYLTTSMELTNIPHMNTVINELNKWNVLKSVPDCWKLSHQLFCSVYLPKCTNGKISLPRKELCEMTRKPCRIFIKNNKWPKFLDCNNSYFRNECDNPLLDSKVNYSCPYPLVPTNNFRIYFDDIDGCGISCNNSIISADEKKSFEILVLSAATASILLNVFSMATFAVDWKHASRYPAMIIFWICLCFTINNLGWISQFVPNAKQDILCRKDGVLRISEPQIESQETVSCTVVFIFIYFPIIAALVWFIFFAYSWTLIHKRVGYGRGKVTRHKVHMHLAAWSIALVFTVLCLLFSTIDAHSLEGICFLTNSNLLYRSFFLILPVIIATSFGNYFLIKGLLLLISLRKSSAAVLGDVASGRIRDTIIRVTIFILFSVVLVVTTLSIHIYDWKNKNIWHENLKNYIFCMNNQHDVKSCSKPIVHNSHLLKFHILLNFFASIILSSWTWTKASLRMWNKKIQKKEGKHLKKVKKHRMIAEAFHKRFMAQNGRLSASYYSKHDDPLGLHLEDSGTSNELSSNWIAAMPRLLMRRNALAISVCRFNNRQNSIDSDLSYAFNKRSTSKESMKSNQHFRSKLNSVESHIGNNEPINCPCGRLHNPVLQYDSDSSVYLQHERYATAEGYRLANLALVNQPELECSDDENYTVLPAITKTQVVRNKKFSQSYSLQHQQNLATSNIQREYYNAALAAACMYKPVNIGLKPHSINYKNDTVGRTENNANRHSIDDAVTLNSYVMQVPYPNNIISCQKSLSSDEDIHSSEWSASQNDENPLNSLSSLENKKFESDGDSVSIESSELNLIEKL